MKDSTDQTYYELLEVSQGATPEELHRAFIRAKSTYAPESLALHSMFSPEEAKQLLVLIEEAYSVLSNESLRKQYDRRISGDPAPAETDNSLVGTAQPQFVFTSRVFATPARPTSVEPPPDGFGSTKFGHYKIDSSMEKEIDSTTEFTGAFIAKIRQYKNVNLDQMSQATRIGRHYLLALEANDYSALPATVFVRGFVKQVAMTLNLNADKVTNSYMSQVKNHRGD